tara:strand:- start:101 stop:442 length:342 start_codon:yes stop_codon:yes gene_type:complete
MKGYTYGFAWKRVAVSAEAGRSVGTELQNSYILRALTRNDKPFSAGVDVEVAGKVDVRRVGVLVVDGVGCGAKERNGIALLVGFVSDRAVDKRKVGVKTNFGGGEVGEVGSFW